ncbi:hypothetical protein HYW76_00815 [Candidatus Pacearchaeota archaeon]|nr:hypothetical protein [Candidatus Pacearchaeota archaeon]
MLGVSEKYLWFFALALLWSLIWKIVACWKAARKNNFIWFIILFVVNTLGILEILYIFLFSKINLNEKEIITSKKRKKK